MLYRGTFRLFFFCIGRFLGYGAIDDVFACFGGKNHRYLFKFIEIIEGLLEAIGKFLETRIVQCKVLQKSYTTFYIITNGKDMYGYKILPLVLGMRSKNI